jgi:hypothetical protein
MLDGMQEAGWHAGGAARRDRRATRELCPLFLAESAPGRIARNFQEVELTRFCHSVYHTRRWISLRQIWLPFLIPFRPIRANFIPVVSLCPEPLWLDP